MLQIPDELFKIRNAGGHMISKFFNWNNFNSRVDVAEFVKNGHLGADVIDHESILAELHFNAEFVLAQRACTV